MKNKIIKWLIGIGCAVVVGYIALIVFAQFIVFQLVSPIQDAAKEFPTVVVQILGAALSAVGK